MNLLNNCLLLIGAPVTLVVAGYWLAARLSNTSPAERLAVSVLIGLSLFIWNVSVLGFFRPISGGWAWACLWPLSCGVLDRRTRTGCWRDISTVLLNLRGLIFGLSVAGFLAMLLWPLLSRPDLVFYDGTSNHDAFFWICGAEFLREHTYMVEPVKSPLQPFTNGVGVFSGGWAPMWGRMASEGLLAMLAAIVGRAPLQLYVAATAALFFPWTAATYLVGKTFLCQRPTLLALLALATLQPLFIFFQGNANLPNLLGTLSGAIVLVALERSLRSGPNRVAWLAVQALGLHALMCSYPEMVPFVLLPAALLWLRNSLFASGKFQWRPNWAPLLAALAGLALNPATSARAWSGFFRSFSAVRTDEIWPLLFRPLQAADYVPALATLTTHTSADLGAVVATLCSLLLLGAAGAAIWRATDRFGALAMMAGAGALLGYTILTRFGYGWQKSAQFAGVFSAALLPFAAINLFSQSSSGRLSQRWSRVALVSLGLFLLYATGRNCFESHKWSQRKSLTQDWWALRDYAREHLANAPVLVDAPSFSRPYFHGMWSIYFLADSHPLFANRGQENGGYLRDYTRSESQAPAEPPQAVLVGAAWAASFDPDSPRLLARDSLVLLAKANRVEAMRGFSPAFGVPESAAANFSLDIHPYGAEQLNLLLGLAPGVEPTGTRWRVTCEVDQKLIHTAEASGSPPWKFAVPLVAGQINNLKFSAIDAPTKPTFPFTVRQIRLETIR